MKSTKLQKDALITLGIYMLVLVWVIGLKCNMEFSILMSKLSMGQMSLAERAEWTFCHMRFNEDGPMFSAASIEDMLANMALFLPVGMILPMVYQKKRYILTPITAFGISLFFEISQFFNTIGGFAYIDLITNTLGAIIGMVLSYFILKLIKPKTASIILEIFFVIFSAIAIFGTVNTVMHIEIYYV